MQLNCRGERDGFEREKEKKKTKSFYFCTLVVGDMFDGLCDLFGKFKDHSNCTSRGSMVELAKYDFG